MNDALKKNAANAVLEFVEDDMIVGVGSGSTVNFFIEALASIKHKIDATVASSVETEKRLKSHNIPVIDLNVAGTLPLYVDGADEVNAYREMIKGGGGALTREKICASCSTQVICIVDDSKKVTRLGSFPVAIEVIPMARSYVAREIVKLGGDPQYRENFVSDNGNIILDVYNFDIVKPLELEQRINNIAGVVANGIFAQRTADKVILANDSGIETF